jgi:hypothetical protein
MKKWTNELSRTFSKEEVQKAKKKKNEEMFNIAGHKGNLNQNHIRFHLTPVSMTTMKNTNKNKCWRGCGEKGTFFIHCWWE